MIAINYVPVLFMHLMSGINSVGRVSASQAECRRFEPGHPLQLLFCERYSAALLVPAGVLRFPQQRGVLPEPSSRLCIFLKEKLGN